MGVDRPRYSNELVKTSWQLCSEILKSFDWDRGTWNFNSYEDVIGEGERALDNLSSILCATSFDTRQTPQHKLPSIPTA